MAKVASKLKALKNVGDKIEHGPFRSFIPAGMATAGPPLGSMLGQVFYFFCFQAENSISISCYFLLFFLSKSRTRFRLSAFEKKILKLLTF